MKGRVAKRSRFDAVIRRITAKILLRSDLQACVSAPADRLEWTAASSAKRGEYFWRTVAGGAVSVSGCPLSLSQG
jgi:hypothetical protein